jgi:hypothetical protein
MCVRRTECTASSRQPAPPASRLKIGRSRWGFCVRSCMRHPFGLPAFSVCLSVCPLGCAATMRHRATCNSVCLSVCLSVRLSVPQLRSAPEQPAILSVRLSSARSHLFGPCQLHEDSCMEACQFHVNFARTDVCGDMLMTCQLHEGSFVETSCRMDCMHVAPATNACCLIIHRPVSTSCIRCGICWRAMASPPPTPCCTVKSSMQLTRDESETTRKMALFDESRRVGVLHCASNRMAPVYLCILGHWIGFGSSSNQ